MDEFWEAIDAQLDAIERERPSTVAGVAAILGSSGDAVLGAAAFFAGSGGDRSLWGSLRVAGWELLWLQAGYFYAARHPASGDVLTYIEGDVMRGNHRPLPALEAAS